MVGVDTYCCRSQGRGRREAGGSKWRGSAELVAGLWWVAGSGGGVNIGRQQASF